MVRKREGKSFGLIIIPKPVLFFMLAKLSQVIIKEKLFEWLEELEK